MIEPWLLSEDEKRFTFVFDPALYPRTEGPVYVYGTFTGWKPVADAEWRMVPSGSRYREKGVPRNALVLEKTLSVLGIPGNCGLPEFKYALIGHDGRPRDLLPVQRAEGFYFQQNAVIRFPGDRPETLILAARTAERIKGLKDFDLSLPEDRMSLANFRKVPGTSCLYRSYHPYKMSFTHLETETTRSRLVKDLMDETGIRSIVCLCGNESADESLGESIGNRQLGIMAAGHQLYVDTSYEEAYFNTAGKDFGSVLGQIIRFIVANPPPYLVHCRLGSDRTGVVCAILAALSGAGLSGIVGDYEGTRNMGIGEYRDGRLLRHALSQLTGHASPGENLQQAMRGYLLSSGIADATLLDSLIAILAGK
jgi:hypothetical protein